MILSALLMDCNLMRFEVDDLCRELYKMRGEENIKYLDTFGLSRMLISHVTDESGWT